MNEILKGIVCSALALTGLLSFLMTAVLVYLYFTEGVSGIPIAFFTAPLISCLVIILMWRSTKTRAWITGWLVPWWGL